MPLRGPGSGGATSWPLWASLRAGGGWQQSPTQRRRQRPLRVCGSARASRPSCDTGGTYEGCAIYHGSDNRLYLRFKPSSLYYIAFSVDSMYVGNGYVLKRNDIEVVNDPSASL